MGAHTPIRTSENGKIGATTLPTVPGWEVKKEQGEQLIDAAEANDGDGLEIKLGGDPIYAAQSQSSPRGDRLPRRRDRAADRVRVGRRGRPAAPGRADRARHHVGRPDRPARQRHRRPRLDHGGLRPDRHRRGHRLLAARADALPLGVEDGKDRHDAVVESVTTAGRSVIAGATVVVAVLGLCLTGLSYMYGVAISASLAVLVVMLASICCCRRCWPTSARAWTSCASPSSAVP